MRAILRLIERSCPVLLVMFALACSDDGPTGDSQLLCGGSASKCGGGTLFLRLKGRWFNSTQAHHEEAA
jgi:hypothetical protein